MIKRVLVKAGIVAVILALVSLSFVSCFTDFLQRKVETQECRSSGQLFGRYSFSIFITRDVDTEIAAFNFDLDFLEDSVGVEGIDTIPIFVVDSFCFSGECIDSGFCMLPMSLHEYYQAHAIDSRVLRSKWRHYKPESPDLDRYRDRVKPVTYVLGGGAYLPLSCQQGHSFTLVINAHLFDRTTGSMIASERREVSLTLSKGKRYLY